MNSRKINLPCQQDIVTLVLMALLLCPSILRAQQDPIYSQFMYNGPAINPAMAGSSETFSATAIYRKQWVGVEGAPETQTFNVEAPVHHNKIGLGLSVINDKVGITKNLLFNTQYAYRIMFNTGTLAMGLQAGINNYRADYTSVETDPQHTIDNAFATDVNRVIFNFGSGVYYYTERFNAGFSVPHILNQSLDGSIDETGVRSRQYRHYFLTAGYVFDAGADFKIKPSTLIKLASGAPLQADINTNLWYKETYSLGVSYRTQDSFSLLVQLQVAGQFRFGYAFDYVLTSLNRFTTGNHEIMLRYEPRKETTRIVTPRYF